ncbi:hypothetical protein QYE76_040983 [Lolium multiflorum]|uniref:Uncharacterized protein n=1 Tax=Lolium multiflorum TaxID=4521 RepID=A0AAD8TC36_LOLMU|nr:hypothetical protein QYE76_040983 [Lolium multiflorum]
MDDFYVTIPYGLVVLGGGIAGYVKRGSAASLAAGAGFGGALLLAGALSIWAFARHSSSLFATVLQTGPLLLLLIPLTHPLFIFVVLGTGTFFIAGPRRVKVCLSIELLTTQSALSLTAWSCAASEVVESPARICDALVRMGCLCQQVEAFAGEHLRRSHKEAGEPLLA